VVPLVCLLLIIASVALPVAAFVAFARDGIR
jgi:hypothetical protein